VGVLSRFGLAVLVVVMTAVAPLAAQHTPHGTYRGHVIEAGSGQPIAGAGVFLVWPTADETGAATPFAYRETRTDRQGQFSIDAAAIEQTLPPRALPPQLWVYKPGYQLYPDRDARPAGASATPLTQPGGTIRLLGARTDADRIEALNDFFAAINRYAPTRGPILLGLIESEFIRLKQVKPDATASPAPAPPSPPGARAVCEVDPKNPPPLPPPKLRRVPEPGTYNPFEGRRAPYYGRVVDAEAGTPLSGAVVVAVWTRRVVVPFHAHSVTHDACEVLTDRDGRFILDGRAIEQGHVARIEPPTFSVFLPGYSLWGVVGGGMIFGRSFVYGDAEGFHDVMIGLVKLQSPQERREAVSALPVPASDIPLERVPRLIEAWKVERASLRLQ
jgi:hypothetical protein